MKETLETLISRLKKEHLCMHYKEYSSEVQEMVEKIYKALFRINLYDAQIVYILDEALLPFKRGGK
jgi:hypothetical protein